MTYSARKGTTVPSRAGTLDAWLHAKTVDACLTKAARHLVGVDTTVSSAITSQVRELASANTELTSELGKARAIASALRHKPSCAENAFRKMRTHVAGILGTVYEPHEEHKALLAGIVGRGYEHTESGKRYLPSELN